MVYRRVAVKLTALVLGGRVMLANDGSKGVVGGLGLDLVVARRQAGVEVAAEGIGVDGQIGDAHQNVGDAKIAQLDAKVSGKQRPRWSSRGRP